MTKCKLVNPDVKIDIREDDADIVLSHLRMITQLLSEGYELHKFQIKMLSDLVKELEITGRYKLKRKRGGQDKDTWFRDILVTFHVINLIDNKKASTTKAFDIVANHHGASPETVKNAYYECRETVQDMVSNDPEYLYFMQKIISDYKSIIPQSL